MGANVSESVALTGADVLQAGGTTGNTTGAGIKVAVVDLGFNGLASAITAGELPGTTIGVDYSGTGLESGTAHGVGVAEHVLDMAPGVEFHCLKVNDEVDLQNAADYIETNGIRIANHSVGWVIPSYYDDTGPINGIINESHDNDGVFWTVSAGNDAERHWRGSWLDSDGDDWLEFSGNDETMRLTSASGTVSLFLNWDQYPTLGTDIDLYVVDKRNKVVASSEAAQTGSQAPSEALSFTYIGPVPVGGMTGHALWKL